MKEPIARPVSAPAPSEASAQPEEEEQRAPGEARLHRTFASVPVAAGLGDPEANEALRAVLLHLAGQLGIRVDQLRIQVGGEAEAELSTRGAHGMVKDGAVHVASELDLAAPTTRRLLAHEAAHLAQTMLPGADTEPVARTRVPAEIEAEVFAESYATTRVGTKVVVPLSPAAAPADVDFDALVALVAQSRKADIARIVSLLSYGIIDWAVTDDDVFDVLQILAMYSMGTARAIARNIGEKYRERLFSNLNPPHYAAHRREILAVCWAAISADEFKSEGYQLLNRLKLIDLDPLEATAVRDAVKLAPKLKEAASEETKRRISEAEAYASSVETQKLVQEGLKESQTEETEFANKQQTKVGDLQDLVDRIKKKLGELFVTDKEALELLDAVAGRCLTIADPAGLFQRLANGLTDKWLDELIDQIPAKGLYQSERRRKAYVYLVATRPPFKNEQVVEKLMSSPWWAFWDTVTSEEAFLAFLLVKSMPERARNAFLATRGGQKWKDVLAKLPANIKESATFNFYQGGTGEKDRQSIFTQLIDDSLWTAAKKDALDATLRLARAAGGMQFAFEQSELHRADKVPELFPLVDKYQLYIEGKREDYKKEEKPLEGRAWYEEGLPGWLADAGRTLSFVFGLKNVQLFGAKKADVNVSGTDGSLWLLGRPFEGLHFAKTDKKERKEAYAQGKLPPNVIRAEKYNNGELFVTAPDLVIDRLFYFLSGGKKLEAAPARISGLTLHARYTPDDYKLISLDVGINRLVLTDCAVVLPDSILSINQLSLGGLSLQITNEALEKTPAQDGMGAMFFAILSPDQAQGIQVACATLKMDGVATSGGSYVQSVEVEGLSLRAGGAAAYQEALQASLQRADGRIAEEQKALAEDAAHADQHQAAIDWLQKQRAQIDAEAKKGVPQGAVIDIRSIKVAGIPGLTDEPIGLQDLHGQGSAVASVVPLFADPTMIRNMVRGTEAAPTVKGYRPGDASFKIAIREVSTTRPIRIAGGIPTGPKAREELNEFIRDNKNRRNKAGYDKVKEALTTRARNAERYEELASKGIQNLDPAKGEIDEFRNLRKWLIAFEEHRATIVESVSLGGVTLDTGTENPELTAETFSAKGLKTFTPAGEESLTVEEISGKDVSLGASFTGGLANLKQWRKNLEKATAKAQQLTFKHVRHAGTDAVIEELSFEGDEEGKGLEATLETGKAPGAVTPGSATLGVKSRKVIARGISIPAHAALLRAEKERIEDIVEEDRLPEERARLKAIDQMLADLARIEQRRKAAEAKADAARSQKDKAAAQKQVSQNKQDLKDWEDRLVINKLTIDQLDVSIGGLGDVLAEGYSFDKDAGEISVEGRGAQGHWFENVKAERVRKRTAAGDQVIADKVSVGPVGGTFRPLKDGFELDGFSVASLSAKGVTYASGNITVQSIGETQLLDITASATFRTGVEKTQGGNARSELDLKTLRIGRIVADHLKYEDADKVVSVVSGELIGLDLSGMHFTLPDDPQAKAVIEGQVKLDAIKSLTLGAVASGYKVDATLNAPKPAGKASALTIGFAKSGEITVALQGLSATADVRQLGTGNKVHIEWKNLGVKELKKNGDDYSLTGLSVGNLTLSHLNWTVGGKTLTVRDKVTLQGISLDAEASLRTKGKGPDKELSKLLIKKLVVNEIDAKDVGVEIPAVEEDKAKGTEASSKKSLHLGEAVIRGLTVTGFDVLNSRGKIEITKSLQVTNLQATIGEVAKGEFTRATASFKVFGKDAEEPGKGGRELSATLTGKDGTILRLGRTDSLTLTNILTSMIREGKGGVKETTETKVDRVSLQGITTGDLIIKEDEVSISDLEIAGPVGIDNLSWGVTGKAAQKLTMTSATLPELMKIGSIKATFKKVPTGKIVKGKEVTKSELDTLTVSDLDLPKVEAKGLHYSGPLQVKEGTRNIELDMPNATMLGIFVHELGKNFTDNTLKLDAKLKSVSAPGFALTLTDVVKGATSTKKLGADLTTGEIRANALFKTTAAGTPGEKTEMADGYFELDSLGLRKITGTISETGKKDQTVGVKEANFSKIRHDTTGTSIGTTTLRGIKSADPNIGLKLDIQELAIPKPMTIPTKGPITIPEANITNAAFSIDDILALGSGPSSPTTGKPVDTEQFYGILDHVNGYFDSDVFLPAHVPVPGFSENIVHVQMQIRDGRFRYEYALSEEAIRGKDLRARLVMDSDVYKTEEGKTVKDMSHAYLALEVFQWNVFEWTPSDEEERKEMMRGEVRLKKIIRPDKTAEDLKKEQEEAKKTPEEKEKAEEQARKDYAAGKRKKVEPGEIELRNVDAKLGVKGMIRLGLGDTGTIWLGTKSADAVTDLTLLSKSTSKLGFGVKQMAVTVDELHLGKTTLKGAAGGAGAEILINEVKDGEVQFAGGKVMSPKELKGTITSASVKNLAVVLGE